MKIWSLTNVDILVVYDFPAMRSMVRSMLAAYGANKITLANNGEQAMELMKKQKFEIVLCDYNLGDGKDGQQLLEEAKEENFLPYSTLFIMITAENTNEMVMGAMDYQPDDYLVKPFTKVVLQNRIRKLQERKEGLVKVSNAMDKSDYGLALSLLEQRLAEDCKNKFELLRLKGELLLQNRAYEAAEKHFSAIVGARDINWAAFGLGCAQYYLRKYEDAEQTFSTLIANNKQFVKAYDWMAKVQNELGRQKSAQEFLEKAVELSPKAVRRQKALAQSAYLNQDLDVAEKAYKSVIRQGKNSCFRLPEDFGGLAQVYVDKNETSNANATLDTMRQSYRHADSSIRLQSALVDGVINQSLGNEARSKAALTAAMQLYHENPAVLNTKQAMQMANACFQVGDKDSGAELMKHVVRNNHENEAILDEAKQLFARFDMQQEGESLVNETAKEVIDVNNSGVELVKQGKLEESTLLFQRAAKAMPENIVINLNAAQSLIMTMQSQGNNQTQMKEAWDYLNRVAKLDAANDRYKKLLDRYQSLQKN